MLQDTVQQIFEHHSRPICRSRDPTHSRIATRSGLRPSDGQRTPLPDENHLLDLRGRDDVGIRAEAPFRLVHGVEMRESRAEDCRARHRLTAIRTASHGTPPDCRKRLVTVQP